MKKIIYFVLISSVLVGAYFVNKHFNTPSVKEEVKELTEENEIQNGDIIFQTSLSAQSKAIQLATHSTYSHCGLIFKEGDKYFVFEAVQPVKSTPLEKWIARGENHHYVIKRLKNADEVLTSQVLLKMKKEGEKMNGKNYDLTFEWSDDKIYCSELVWKLYQRATGVEVGKLEHLRDFDLSNPAVKAKLKERYGSNIPMDETVISPASIFNSDKLRTVKSY
ncbi:MAG: YiiX family permuted papain-like enzyme [Cytophagaceae bacterium]